MADVTKLISIDHVKIGMYIKLDLNWFEHSFPVSSFRITNEQQIRELVALNLKQIRYIPSKSDPSSLRRMSMLTEPEEKVVVVPENAKVFESIIEAKKARFEKLQQQRAEIIRCEAKFVQAANVVRNIDKLIFSQPEKTLHEAGKLVEGIAEVFASGNDAIMHLIQQSEGSEELYFHGLNVSVLSMMLAHELKCTQKQIKTIGLAGLFHDVGKVDIPDQIKKKTTPLTKIEHSIYELHTQYGLEIGRKAGMDKVILDVIANHHEYVDGTGFPDKLKGDQIRLATRIITIANVYDNLCNNADPKKSITPHEALSLMYAHRRSQFDPAAMATLVKCLGVYPPGTLVRLSNDSVGLVMNVNVGMPLRPRVLIYDDEIPKEDAIILDLAVESQELSIQASIRPGLLPRAIFEYLNPRKRISYYADYPAKNTHSHSAN